MMSMPAGYDAWLTTDVEGERRQERADYCADNHPDFDGEGECPSARPRTRIGHKAQTPTTCAIDSASRNGRTR